MLRFSLDAIASFSYRPLQLATLLGFVISLVAFIAIPVVIVLKIVGYYLYGFSTVEITMLLLGGIQLITIGMIGEYVGRIFDEVKGRPLYLVRSRQQLRRGAGAEPAYEHERPTSTPSASDSTADPSAQPPAGFGPRTVLVRRLLGRPSAAQLGRGQRARAPRSAAPGP